MIRKPLSTLLVVLVVCLLFVQWTPAVACTGLYVGKKCAADGHVMIGRSNDYYPSTVMPYVAITEAQSGVPGRKVCGINGFTWELPATTCRYVSVPYTEVSDYGRFASVAMNDYGVALTATVTGYYCKEAAAADPDVVDGVAEETIPDVLAPCCKTAREAIELLAKIIDQKGSAEQNIVMVADQKEAWYMEIYSGHQYCAIRMPEDMVAVFGNEYMLDTVDPKDKSGVICSKGLFTLPKKAGFAVMDSNGKMNLRRTYSGDGRFYDFAHLRTWGGHKILSPSTIGDYEPQTYYPLFFHPDGKVTLQQAMEIYRDRYAGTKYNPEENNAWDNRVIGDETQEQVHVVQVRDDLPAPMACVTWLTLSEAAHAPFVPISSAITDCNENYKFCAQQWGYNKEQGQHIYKRVNAFCAMNRKTYSQGVKDYWKRVERHVVAEYPKVVERAAQLYAEDSSRAQQLLTDYCTSVQDDCIYDARRLFDEMTWHMMEYSLTNHYDCDFTNLVNHPKPLPAFVPRFDVARFAQWYGCTTEYRPSERSVVISRDGHTIVVRANGTHRTEKGVILYNGREVATVDAVLSDGKIWLNLKEFSQYLR